MNINKPYLYILSFHDTTMMMRTTEAGLYFDLVMRFESGISFSQTAQIYR